MCLNKNSKIIIFYLITFFIFIYLTMIAKRLNDITYDIYYKNTNIKSFFDIYIEYIINNNELYKFHKFLIKWNYTYVPIFIITFVWIFFYSNMVSKILKRYLIICNLYSIYHTISLFSTYYYKDYKDCNYIPEYYDIYGLFRCYTYKQTFLLYSLIMLYIFNRYHTSIFIKYLFVILNTINVYISLIAKQIYLSQLIETTTLSFLLWTLYDNPYYFKKTKKKDMESDKKRIKKFEFEMQKSKIYENSIDINDF